MKKTLNQSMKKPGQQQSAVKPKINIIINKPFNPNDYITSTLMRDEILEIRKAFEIFDKE
jgi:hypothetical protein